MSAVAGVAQNEAMPRPAYEVRRGEALVYDAALLQWPRPGLFSPAFWRGLGRAEVAGSGRGAVWFIQAGDQRWVLRHYRRGGAVARLVEDAYLRTGIRRSRPWREWHLLHDLWREGYPVPRPIAARIRLGALTYRADIITCRLDGRTLADRLRNGPLSASRWRAIGATVAEFHGRGLWHADLNAHNILLDDDQRIYLLDLDRCVVRRVRPGWRRRNLGRLRRSLDKLSACHGGFAFERSNWHSLLRGYSERWAA